MQNYDVIMDIPEFVKVDLNLKEHRKELLKLLGEYMQDEMGNGKLMNAQLGTKIIEGLYNHHSYCGFFVRVNTKYIALANCNLNFSTWKARPLINIHDFIVSENFRKQGYGRFLLNEIEKFALEVGCCRLNLEVRHDNLIAQKLYKRAGFQECSPPNFFWEKRL